MYNRKEFKGDFSITSSDNPLADKLADDMRECMNSHRCTPPMLPGAALEVMQLARTPEPDFKAIASSLEKDPLLAARVLRTANTALFASGGRIDSIRHALVRLGVGTVRNLVLQEAMNLRVFRSRIYRQEAEGVRVHCFATALAARSVAEYTPLSPEYMYMVGLLHDVGLVLGLGALEVLAGPKEITPFPSAVYWPALIATHEEANGLMCTRWNMPPELTLLLSQHHHVMLGGQPHPGLAVLALAEVFADLRGFGVTRRGSRPMKQTGRRPDERPQQVIEEALTALDLSELQFDAARQRVDAVFLEAFGQRPGDPGTASSAGA